MKNLIVLLTFVIGLLSSTSAVAQLNTKPLEEKGFEAKYKFKPYKKTSGYLLKLKVKNVSLKSVNVAFQLYMYVNGKAEIMSEQNSTCIGPNKKGKYRFLFEGGAEGTKTIEFEKLKVEEVELCNSTN